MTTYFANAFSFNMIAAKAAALTMKEVTAKEAAEYLLAPAESWGYLGHRTIDPLIVQAVGHADTAALFAKQLDLDGIEPSRKTVSLKKGDHLVVGQYSGPRLPEGATELPEGATIRWLIVDID